MVKMPDFKRLFSFALGHEVAGEVENQTIVSKQSISGHDFSFTR